MDGLKEEPMFELQTLGDATAIVAVMMDGSRPTVATFTVGWRDLAIEIVEYLNDTSSEVFR